ncbi:MAG: response regulator transcription factor [Candidatus Eremiobacteraeota bacterium]|nr:response regulator transcription factor [Candidatus Eremiobacteraeota bacterium]
MITVTILDDHPIVLDGIRAVLEAQGDFLVRASVTHERELPNDPGDVLVLDWELGGGEGGTGTIRRLRERYKSLRIVIFSAYAHDERVRSAIDAGASGYVLKGSPAEQLISAIRSVAAGASYFGDGVAPRVLNIADGVTPRELDVLRAAERGLSNGEIAQALDISERTVKFHMSSILSRLGAKRRAQAVAIARERGLL